MDSIDNKDQMKSTTSEQYVEANDNPEPLEFTPLSSREHLPLDEVGQNISMPSMEQGSHGVSLGNVFGSSATTDKGKQPEHRMQRRQSSSSSSSLPIVPNATTNSSTVAKMMLQQGFSTQHQQSPGIVYTQGQGYDYEQQQQQQQQQQQSFKLHSQQQQMTQGNVPLYHQGQQATQAQVYKPVPAPTYTQPVIQYQQQQTVPQNQSVMYSLSNSMQNMSIGTPMVAYNQPAQTFNKMGTDKKGEEVFRPPPGLEFKQSYDGSIVVLNPDGKLSITPIGIIDLINDPDMLGNPIDGHRFYIERTISTPPLCTLVCDNEKDIADKVKSTTNTKLYTIRTGLKWLTGGCASTYYIANCIIKYLPEEKQAMRQISGSREVAYFATYALIGFPIGLFEWMRLCAERMGMKLYKGSKDLEVSGYLFSNFNVSKGKHICVSYNGTVDGQEQTIDLSNEERAIMTVMNSIKKNMLCDIYAEFNIKREGREANGQIKYCLSPSIKHVHLISTTDIDPPTPNVESRFVARAGTRLDATVANALIGNVQSRANNRTAIDVINRGGGQVRPGYHAVPSMTQPLMPQNNPYGQQSYAHQQGQPYTRPL